MAGKVRGVVPVLVVVLMLVGVPLAVLLYQAHHSGLSWRDALSRLTRPTPPDDGSSPSTAKTAAVRFLTPRGIGDPPTPPPRISNVCLVDLDKDGLMDVVVCDALTDRVTWIRQSPRDVYTEVALAMVRAPAHVCAVDMDRDGDLDLLVASMGMLFPNNDKIGSVVILENDGKQQFTARVVAEKIARVTDVRAGDLDGDGDLDLAVGQFGYDDGEIRWMENLGGWQFKSHKLLGLSGTIHTPAADMDGDGDLDIVAIVSQEWEEIYVFENEGKGHFTTRLAWGSSNEDFGSSGIDLVDLDRDGDLDVLYTNGDAFDYIPPRARPWHGVQWLENKGGLKFVMHRLGDFPGAYSARAADVDGDGDLDVVVVSGFNFWERPDAQSMMWFENDGRMGFRPHDLANGPTHLITLEAADMNGDGKADFVTGGMHTYAPFDRMGRVTLWINRWPQGGKPR